jgi:hypothetical protein
MYGDGDRAFRKLQEGIMKIADGYTVFTWNLPTPAAPPSFATPDILACLLDFKASEDRSAQLWNNQNHGTARLIHKGRIMTSAFPRALSLWPEECACYSPPTLINKLAMIVIAQLAHVRTSMSAATITSNHFLFVSSLHCGCTQISNDSFQFRGLLEGLRIKMVVSSSTDPATIPTTSTQVMVTTNISVARFPHAATSAHCP